MCVCALSDGISKNSDPVGVSVSMDIFTPRARHELTELLINTLKIRVETHLISLLSHLWVPVPADPNLRFSARYYWSGRLCSSPGSFDQSPKLAMGLCCRLFCQTEIWPSPLWFLRS